MSAIAHFSGTLARGVVYMGEKVYVIEVKKMYKPEEAGGTHFGMWMQGPDDIKEMEAGDYPFTAVYDCMNNAFKKVRARSMRSARRWQQKKAKRENRTEGSESKK